jgi:hypothetical protein
MDSAAECDTVDERIVNSYALVSYTGLSVI